MREIKLGEICHIINGSTPSRKVADYFKGDIHWFTPKDLSKLTGKYIQEAPERISAEGYKSCSTTLIPPFSLLFTSRAPIGHLAINTVECCTNQGFKSLVPKNENVDINYLYYVIKKNVPVIQDMGRGATFKELSKKAFEEFKIPLPSLIQQQKIASILDEADKLSQLNKELVATYEQLGQSLFLEMFGDPVSNPKRCKKVSLSKLGKVITGSTPSSKKSGMFNGSIPFLTPGDLESGFPAKRFLTEEGAENSRIVPKNSLLVCCIGATIGKKDIAKEKSTFNQQLNAVVWNEKINPLFGYYSFNWLRNEVIKRAISTTLPILKKSEFEKLELIVPEIELQDLFSSHIIEIEKQKLQAQQALEHSEELFKSLLQRAFRGELVGGKKWPYKQPIYEQL